MKRPNIIIVMSDQQRHDAVGYSGNTQIKTPCLDRLAAEGVVFENAYTPIPLCVPSRTCMLNGTYLKDARAANHHKLAEGEWSFVRELRDSGYRTAAIGKMHFYPMYADHGFEVMRLAEHDPNQPGCFTEDDYHRELLEAGYRDEQEEWQFPTKFVNAPQEYRENLQAVPFPHPEPWHSTAWIGREAIKFLEEHDGEQPYFMFVSLFRPHHPFNPPVPYDTMYDPEALDVPDPAAGWESLPEFLQPFYSTRLAHKTFDLANLDRKLLQKITSYYYGTISHIDDWVERILEKVDRDNTIVLYTTDHGEYLGNRGRLMKDPQVPLDDLVRIPLVASWPGRWAPHAVEAPVSMVDFAPTFLELAGVERSAHLEGDSIVPLLEGSGGTEWKERAVYAETQHSTPSLMIREGRWKYIWHPPQQVGQLYDMEADPGETRNLAGVSEYEAVEARLLAKLLEWKARTA